MGKSDRANIIGCDIKVGHGISIDRLGKFQNEEPVEGTKVSNCTITNTSNGVRIKTWPGESLGTVSEIHLEDITVNNVSSPILIDQKYFP
ncbi:hypothetical protein Goarm_022803 [Gossypium armourianum]|uniref:Polygalacturonase n=1 Tax=Gossypium armourianum TaxID=34283 RepID=A0A7J9KF63_9ROSI|nr:hypothetical protein [Gossypium armourianum]